MEQVFQLTPAQFSDTSVINEHYFISNVQSLPLSDCFILYCCHSNRTQALIFTPVGSEVHTCMLKQCEQSMREYGSHQMQEHQCCPLLRSLCVPISGIHLYLCTSAEVDMVKVDIEVFTR